MNEIEKISKNVSQRINKNVQCEDCPFECDGSLPCYLVTMCNALQEKAERDKMRCENCNRRVKGADLSNTVLCRWLHDLTMPKNGFCSYFEPKENENG